MLPQFSHAIVASTRILLLSVFAVGAPAQGQAILFVRADAATYNAEEQVRVNGLQNAGYAVAPIWDRASQSAFNTGIAGADAVYVSKEASGANIAYKLREAPIGVVSEEASLDTRLGFATADGSVRAAAAITLSAGSHEVTTGFAAGNLTLTASSQSLITLQGTIAPDAQTLATLSGAAAMAVVEVGGELANGYSGSSVAAGRRVRLPIGGDAFAIASANSNAQTLILQAVAWAASGPSGLLLHLKLDEAGGTAAMNSASSGGDATYVASPQLGVAGKRSTGVQFAADAAFDRVQLPINSINRQQRASVAWWMKTPKRGQQGILSGARVGSDNAFLLFMSRSDRFNAYIDGTNRTIRINAIDDGAWRHFVFTHDRASGVGELFINGEAVGRMSFSPNTGQYRIDPGGLVLGEEQDAVGGRFVRSQAFQGVLDDFRIYNRVLTQAEISELFGLIGHWSFNEGKGTKLADASPNRNDAKFDSGKPAWVAGVRGTALYFDGASDAVTTIDVQPPAEGTVALWIQSAGPPPSRQRPWGIGTHFDMWQDPDGRFSCNLSTDGSMGGFMTIDPLYEAGRWYHLAAVYDSADDSYEIYLNGKLHTSGTSKTDLAPQPADLLTFGRSTGSKQRFIGALDDLRIYSYKLSAAEIAELYGLIGHWKLDEPKGAIAYDSSGIGNDGKHQGGVEIDAFGPYPGVGDRAAEYDGRTGQTDIGEIDFDFSDGFTAALWVKPTASLATGEFQPFLDLGNGANVDEVWLGWVQASGFQLYMSDTADGSALRTIEDNAGFETDKWVHCVAVVDGSGSATLYRNGEVTKSGFYTSLPANVSRRTNVLAASPWKDRFAGGLHDVRVYNRPLSRSEVAELYGLVGWWKLDETSGTVAYDSSGMDNHALHTTRPVWTTGYQGGAASFDGGRGYFTNSTIAPRLNGNLGVAASVWVNANKANVDRDILFTTSPNGSDNRVSLRYDQAGWGGGGRELIKAAIGADRGEGQLEGESDSQTTSWQHIAMSWTSGEPIRMWVNGTEQKATFEFYPSGGVVSGVTELMFGYGTKRRTWDGLLDDVRIYNRPIGDEEVMDLYNSGETPGLRIIRWVESR